MIRKRECLVLVDFLFRFLDGISGRDWKGGKLCGVGLG